MGGWVIWLVVFVLNQLPIFNICVSFFEKRMPTRDRKKSGRAKEVPKSPPPSPSSYQNTAWHIVSDVRFMPKLRVSTMDMDLGHVGGRTWFDKGKPGTWIILADTWTRSHLFYNACFVRYIENVESVWLRSFFLTLITLFCASFTSVKPTKSSYDCNVLSSRPLAAALSDWSSPEKLRENLWLTLTGLWRLSCRRIGNLDCKDLALHLRAIRPNLQQAATAISGNRFLGWSIWANFRFSQMIHGLYLTNI